MLRTLAAALVSASPVVAEIKCVGSTGSVCFNNSIGCSDEKAEGAPVLAQIEPGQNLGRNEATRMTSWSPGELALTFVGKGVTKYTCDGQLRFCSIDHFRHRTTDLRPVADILKLDWNQQSLTVYQYIAEDRGAAREIVINMTCDLPAVPAPKPVPGIDG